MANIVLDKTYKCLNLKSLNELMDLLEYTLGYLEKASNNNLGDFTAAGKIVNAGYNNYTLYWKYYKELGMGNYQKEPYCAGYVSTMLATAFGIDTAKALLCGDLYIYCPTGFNQFNSKGRIYTTPKRGDIVFFWSNSKKRYSHTGFVFAVDADGKGYTTIEANTSSGNDVVVANGGATCRKHYTLANTVAKFGRPDYEGNGISITNDTGIVTYGIATDDKGLTVKVTNKINVRSIPGSTSDTTIITQLSKGDIVFPSQKTFVNGKAWFYIPANDGWMSASYLEGWVKENSVHDKWWYLLDGYNWYTSSMQMIDEVLYYFDDAGYMFLGKLVLTTSESGALRVESTESYDEV